MSDFTNDQVQTVSVFLQEYMKKNKLTQLSADECAELLAKNNIMTNTIGPKPGFNFRQMLRDGRNGKIHLVIGAHQTRPKTKWRIFSVG